MKLNCQPNQLAYVFTTPTLAGCYAHMVGIPVKVLAPAMPDSFSSALTMVIDNTILWRVEKPVTCARCGVPMQLFPDSILRPFEPGSEPKDESEPVHTEAPATV